MSRKKRPAPPPPTTMALQTTPDRSQPLASITIGQFIEDHQERPASRNSSPSSHDSGIPSDSESNLTFASSNEDTKASRQQHDLDESSISDSR